MSDQIRKDIENMQKSLQRQQEELARIEKNCKHDFPEVKYDPEPYDKPVFSHYEPCGSDPYPVYNYVKSEKKRWSRKCTLCGKEEYTYNLKQIDKYEPDFGGR